MSVFRHPFLYDQSNSRRILKFTLGCCLLVLNFSCKKSTPPPTFDPDIIRQEVETAVWAFHAADTARNAQGVIDLLWPNYTMLGDGKLMTYNDVVKGSPEFMNSIEHFHTEWSNLHIISISEDTALSYFTFKDSIIFNTGELTQAQGPTTFLWQKRDGEWRVRYGDADHYPLEKKKL